MDYKKFEVDLFSKNYETEKSLGSGGYGTTFLCVHNLDKKRYVVKLIPCTDDNTKKMLRECEAMAMLKHANVVRYYCAWLEAGTPECARDFAGGLISDSKGTEGDDFAAEETEENFSGGVEDSEEKFAGVDDDSEEKFAGVDDGPEEKEEEKFAGVNDVSEEKFAGVDDDSKEKEVEKFAGVGDDSDEEEEENFAGVDYDAEEKEQKKKEKHTRTLCIAMEYYPRVLENELKDGTNFTEEEVMKIFKGLAEALDYIHGEGWLHCDFHPGNVFLDNKGNPIVGDFGLSRKNEGDVIVSRGKEEYLANEVLNKERYTSASDMFSFSLLMTEVLCSVKSNAEKVDIFTKARNGELPDKLKGWDVVRASVRAILEAAVPTERLTARNILDSLQ